MNAPMFRHSSDMQKVRRQILDKLGSETLRELHESNRFLDLLTFVVLWGLCLTNGWALATQPFGFLWVGVLFFQGFVIQLIAMFAHDAFVHRKVFGETISYYCGAICLFPIFFFPLSYELWHLDHHRYIGTERDAEAFKNDIDTFWKRIFFLTVPGVHMARSRKFAGENSQFPAPTPWSAETDLMLKREKKLFLAFMLLVIGATVLFPAYLGYGYWLVMFTTAPVAAVMRIILEHAEADPSNPYHVATYYKTGWITRPLFLWNSGDCHLIHHYFASIPYYRTARALRLIRPIIDEAGVVQRNSFLGLLKAWFIDVYPHRAAWPKG